MQLHSIVTAKKAAALHTVGETLLKTHECIRLASAVAARMVEDRQVSSYDMLVVNDVVQVSSDDEDDDNALTNEVQRMVDGPATTNSPRYHPSAPPTTATSSAGLSEFRNPPVGIVNQGATCFLSAMLQCWYHTPLLREIVFRMAPARPDRVLLEMQRVFWKMQFSQSPVHTQVGFCMLSLRRIIDYHNVICCHAGIDQCFWLERGCRSKSAAGWAGDPSIDDGQTDKAGGERHG